MCTNSRAPVKTPADLKGLKIRTNNSPMNIAAFKVFGANPIPMPFAEVYTGLETRTIDAQEHPINVVWSAKFFEVQKYLSLTHHAYSPLLVVINKAKFDGLTPGVPASANFICAGSDAPSANWLPKISKKSSTA
ncbi:TRAP transporter substrate-binding protein DctP [Escherichia coli]